MLPAYAEDHRQQLSNLLDSVQQLRKEAEHAARAAIRHEIKLRAHQVKGSKSRTVVLSHRVQGKIDTHLKGRSRLQHDRPLIASRRNGRAFSNVSLPMLFKPIYELAGIRTSPHSGRLTFVTRLDAKGVGMRTIQKLMGHRHIGTAALYCNVSDDTLRNAVELV
jgi:integrase/recombinase XerD